MPEVMESLTYHSPRMPDEPRVAFGLGIRVATNTLLFNSIRTADDVHEETLEKA
jgi:hypothetical protein